MKVRAILKSLLFAYALTGVALLLLALVLFAFDLGETAVDADRHHRLRGPARQGLRQARNHATRV